MLVIDDVMIVIFRFRMALFLATPPVVDASWVHFKWYERGSFTGKHFCSQCVGTGTGTVLAGLKTARVREGDATCCFTVSVLLVQQEF